LYKWHDIKKEKLFLPKLNLKKILDRLYFLKAQPNFTVPLMGGQSHYQFTEIGIITTLILSRWLQLIRVFFAMVSSVGFFQADTFLLKQNKYRWYFNCL